MNEPESPCFETVVLIPKKNLLKEQEQVWSKRIVNERNKEKETL
jgi:hypothetical protein